MFVIQNKFLCAQCISLCDNVFRYVHILIRYVQNIFCYVHNVFHYVQNVFRYVQKAFRYVQNIFRYVPSVFRYAQNVFRYVHKVFHSVTGPVQVSICRAIQNSLLCGTNGLSCGNIFHDYVLSILYCVLS